MNIRIITAYILGLGVLFGAYNSCHAYSYNCKAVVDAFENYSSDSEFFKDKWNEMDNSFESKLYHKGVISYMYRQNRKDGCYDDALLKDLFKRFQNFKITCINYYPNGQKHKCRYYSGGRGAKDSIPCGIDIAVPRGTRIYAPADGIVRDVGFDEKGFGFHFEILHDDGTVTLYGHLQYYGYVYEGKRVKKGKLIALSGNSGNSTGPHLHFEMSQL